MFEVKRYFAEDNEVDKWEKLNIFFKIKEIQKTKTSVKIECISFSEELIEYFSGCSKDFFFSKWKHQSIKSMIISESQPTIQCQCCEKNIVNIKLTTIKLRDRCDKCIKNDYSCFDICENCLQKLLSIDFSTLYKKICCHNRFNEFNKNLSFEIDLDSFIKPNWVFIQDRWLQISNTNRYYENLEVFAEYDNIDQCLKEFSIEDEEANLTFTYKDQKYEIKFDPRTTDKNILFLLFNNKKIAKNDISTYNECFICWQESEILFLNCENIGPTCRHLVCEPCYKQISFKKRGRMCQGCRRPYPINLRN